MYIFHAYVSLAEGNFHCFLLKRRAANQGRALFAAQGARDPAKEAKVLRQMFRVHFDRGDLQEPTVWIMAIQPTPNVPPPK